jgi:type VI protein secretion system component VasK
MKLEGIPQPLRKVWEFVGLHWLLILLIVLALVLAAALVVFLMYQSRKKAAPAPAAGAAARPAAPPAPHTGQLRDAWVRFLRKLPQAYRRSLLNFEHFVLMGAASSGKTKLVDDYSDWRRQTKEFASSQPNDPDLPVYLASSEVITELPARVL